ncbi:MAG: DUF559 domain-containing protein [Acidobacteria bacterium]|nr:MAG: DUF559 domain-containing protein [Acidobacteriota bacterium]
MARERDISEPLVPLRYVHAGDTEIAEIARQQHGVVSSTQLEDLGLGGRAVRKRCSAGRLHRIHRGIYAVGHSRLTIQGYRMAAVLFGGPGTVLGHRAAGSEWDLRHWRGAPSIITPTPRRPIAGIEIHHSVLPADERTVLDGIPITTWPHTLLDLATILDHDALVRALNEAEARRLSDPLSLAALLDRHRGRRGAGALRRALDDGAACRGVTRGELEERFAAFVRRRRLPPPLLNAPVVAAEHNYVADALWPAARLIVELQSVSHHGSPRAMSADADRTRRLTLAGYRVVYVTWAQLGAPAEAAALAGDITRLLTAAGRRVD